MSPEAVKITHPDKVLFPEDGYTKANLADYYRRVARWLLPYLRERPLTLQRWPEGIDGASFFMKSAPRGTPSWVKTVSLPAKGGEKMVDYVVCDDEATLLWAVNLATVTFHVWYSRLDSLDSPDYVLLDLDPWEGCTLGTLARVALRIRDRLTAVKLAPLVKTSGGSGLHVVVPVATRWDYELAKTFAELVAHKVQADDPGEVTLERSLAKRARGSVYVDWVQVGRGKTVVPPFVVRAHPGAPVSTPLSWDEVEALTSKRTTDTGHELGRWTITNVPPRLERDGDPWQKGWKTGDLAAAIERARSAWKGLSAPAVAKGRAHSHGAVSGR